MKNLLLMAALLASAAAAAQISTGTVSGEIRNLAGQPAAGVRVSAMAVPETGTPANSGTALVSISTTDDQGRYKLENVLPGRYYITAGFIDLPTYYPGVSAMSGATVVNVLSGTPVTGINFAVTNTLGVTVSGRVRRASGTGGIAAQAVAMIGGTPLIQQVTTAADGTFQFQRVLPGTYRLSAARMNGQPVSVVVGDQDITGLDLEVIPTVTVTGTIAVEGNGPRPRVQIQFSPFRGTGQTTGFAPQPDGSFQATMPEGEYRVSWSNLPTGYVLKSVTAGSVDLLSTSLKVSADAPSQPIKVLLAVDGNPWVKVSGRVINFGSNRALTLSGSNAEQLQLTVNPDGTFEIPQALPGTYQIRLNPTGPAASLAPPPVSVVIPSQGATNMVITLPLTKQVPGIIVNSAGAGIQGGFTLNYTQRSDTSSSSGVRSMTTQPDGRFTLEMPVGGAVQLSVSLSGYPVKSITYGMTDLSRQSMTVSETDTETIRVVMDTTSTTAPGGGVAGGAGGGVVSGVLGGILSSSSSFVLATPPPLSPSTQTATAVNRIAEAVAKTNLESSAPPVYPPLARAARVQGDVVLQVEITTQGRVQNVSVVTGHALLNQAAIDAVRQWTYKPFVLNGQAIPVVTTATVSFTTP